MKKIEIGELKEECADNCGLIDLNAIRFPNEIASVQFCADFEIIEQEENDDPKMQPEPKALAGVSDMTQREVNRLLKGIAEKEQCRVSVKEDKAELLTMEQWEAAVRAIRKELGEEEQDE